MQRLLLPCVGLGLGFYSRYKDAAGALIKRGSWYPSMLSEDCEAPCFVFSRKARIVVYFFSHCLEKDSLLPECSVLCAVMMKGFAATVLMECFFSLYGMRGLGVSAFKSRVCMSWFLRSLLLRFFFF
jgi:hypothetical protein